MNSKQRVYAALRREPADRVPIFMWFHPGTTRWLAELLEYSLKGGGKRVRPILSLLCGKLHSYNLDRLMPMAMVRKRREPPQCIWWKMMHAAPRKTQARRSPRLHKAALRVPDDRLSSVSAGPGAPSPRDSRSSTASSGGGSSPDR